MFQILVKYNGWAKARDSMPHDRVFEYTNDWITDQFKPKGKLNRQLLTTLPTLFLSEVSGTGDQNARLGVITRVGSAGKDIRIDYAIDSEIPAIPNKVLQKLSADLGMAPFEFSRTHWAIKDVDLFEVLFRNQMADLPTPKVFKLENLEGVDDNLLSVMMPFHKKFDDVYSTIRGAAKAADLICLRADDIWKNETVIQDVVSLINHSRIVICDCTGKNPNVFYEAGIAHTLGRDVILIAQSENDVPFDVSHIRHVIYQNTDEGRKQLTTRLRQRIQTLLK